MRYLPLLLLLTGCYADELDNSLAQDPFFDLRGYMQTQIDSLNRAGASVTKTIRLNGETETQVRDDIDFLNDLRAFREADINKPDWYDRYETRGTSYGTTYTALDSGLVVRELAIEGGVDDPRRITILRRTGSVLSDGRQRLEYTPGRGYRIETRQENRFGKDVDGSIVVELR